MILLTLIGSVFVQIAHSQSSGCGILHEGEPGAGGLWRTIQTSDPYFGGTEREYLIYIPSTYTPDNPSPLVLDFHGWGGSADWHIKDSLWDAVGEEEGLIIVVPNGIPDAESGTRTWNITKEYDTEYGWRCDPDRSEYGENECHISCSEWCNPAYGCTAGTTCYNDQAFIEQLIQNIQETYCVDNKHVHISGYSNGGTFTYRMFSYSHLNLGGFGSVSGAPFIGRGDVPYPPRSLIDFHGLDDWTVPRQYDHSPGEGPLGDVRTIMSWDGLYYYYKPEYLDWLADSYTCDEAWVPMETGMDGVSDWICTSRLNCDDGAEITKCEGNYGHTYPFNKGSDKIEAARILWKFFKSHPANM